MGMGEMRSNGIIPDTGCLLAILMAKAWLFPPLGLSTASTSLRHVGGPCLSTS